MVNVECERCTAQTCVCKGSTVSVGHALQGGTLSPDSVVRITAWSGRLQQLPVWSLCCAFATLEEGRRDCNVFERGTGGLHDENITLGSSQSLGLMDQSVVESTFVV